MTTTPPASLPDRWPPSEGPGLYIHVPFCQSKCPYCAFYSVRPKAGQFDLWARATLVEIRRVRDALQAAGQRLATIYFGGGTPSVLPDEIWQQIISAVETLPLTDHPEITVEANPESLTPEKLRLWHDLRATRISLGVQTLDDTGLRRIARPHTAARALSAVEETLSAGYRVSCDLIFGLPCQTLRNWHNDLIRLVATGITHISVYQLTIEERSAWGHRPPANLPDGYPMYRWAQYLLPHKGLRQYEIASFARPGHESRHNLAYWRRTDVHAIGPAAWSYLHGTRSANVRDLDAWAATVLTGANPIDYQETLRGAREASEAAILALRTRWGIEIESFAARYGEDYTREILRRLDGLPAAYIARTTGAVALTPRGMRVGNAIWTELLDLDAKE